MLERGTIVAGYRVDGVLGDGGMGVVYRATQLSLGREVALKLLSSDLGDDSGFRIRFQREGQLQAALDHDHIVPVYEAGQSAHGLFLAMRMIDGPTLKDLILAGELDPRRSLRLLAQVANALDTAHAAGLIHRDIKPQNILIDRGDHAFLADFGLIKAPDEAARLTGTGQFIGTIDYVAPEQIQGDSASAASDIYSLTGVLYETLTGEVPFPRPNEAATLHSHVIAPPPRVTGRRADLPEAIDDVVARGMAKDPSARPPSAAELLVGASRALSSSSLFRAAPDGVSGAQATVVRERPSAVSPTSSTPALERAGDDGLAAMAAAEAVGTAPVAEAAASAPVAEAAATAPVAEEVAPVAAAEEPRAPRGGPARSAAGRPVGAAVFLALAAAAGVVGYLIGHKQPHTTEATVTNSAAVNRLQLRYPPTWELSAHQSVVPGMTFDAPLVLTRRGRGGRLVAGTVAAAAGPTLLPHSFRARVKQGLPRPEEVRLGSTPFYRYGNLHIRGLPGTMTLYATPTSDGVATITCSDDGTVDAAFRIDCGRIASTVRLIGVSTYPLGHSPAYASLLSDTFGRLRADSRRPLAALSGTTTASERAAAAQQLAGAYTTAADRLSAAHVTPIVRDEQASVIAALRGCAHAYRSAATAATAEAAVAPGNTTTANGARTQAAAAYRSAQSAVAAASGRLSRALRGLSSLGYTVAGQR